MGLGQELIQQVKIKVLPHIIFVYFGDSGLSEDQTFDTHEEVSVRKFFHVFHCVCKGFLFFSYYLTQPIKSNILHVSYALLLM